ncbi:hypothetical protein V6N13_050366 [Hibiscus sabdariffa]|uniref:Uncharacterized protein n=2 Tax=Hibiscus sabdariffa TaxID=183260 RepID=A0ABR2P4H1_9ROSI
MDIKAWIKINLSNPKDFVRILEDWDVLFGDFDSPLEDNRSILECNKHLQAGAANMSHAGVQRVAGSGSVQWQLQPLDWVLVNSDGARKKDTGRAACGGVIRQVHWHQFGIGS